MRILGAVGLAVMLLASGAGAKQTNKPDLKLMASLDMAAPEQQPILVDPHVEPVGPCVAYPRPTPALQKGPRCVSLEVKFVPENSSQPQPAIDCGLQVDGSGLPDIRERAKKWLTLKPGQDL